MSTLSRTNGTNGTNGITGTTRYARDPFQVARDLLSWDPFFGGRQASAFSPQFEVKETPRRSSSRRTFRASPRRTWTSRSTTTC